MSDRKLVSLTEVEPEQLTWLWRGRIPLKGVTLLEGDPGDGKSRLLYDLAARVTTGRPMPFTGENADPAGVVLLQAEDPLHQVVRPVLDAAGADIDRVFVYDRTRFATEPLSLTDDLQLIEDAIDSVGAKLLVIDPFHDFSGHAGNSEAAVRKTMRTLAQLADTKDVAVVVVRHLRKQQGSNLKHGGLGTMAFVAAARSVLAVVADPSSDSPYQHILGTSKSNLADAPALSYKTVQNDGIITVEWIGEVRQSLSEIVESGGNRYEYSQLEEACFVLYVILAEHDGLLLGTDVKRKASEALVSERTLKRAKRKLKVVSRQRYVWDEEQQSDVLRWVWILPENDEDLKPYKDRAIREHVDDLLDSVHSGPAADQSHAPTASEVSLTTSSQTCDEPDADDEPPDWTPTPRPWDD